MHITAAITAILACSTAAALPLSISPLSPQKHDDFALQLLKSHKRVLEPDVEFVLKKSNGPDSIMKRGWDDLLALPGFVAKIQEWSKDGHP